MYLIPEGPHLFQEVRTRVELAFSSCFINRVTDFDPFGVVCDDGDITPLPTYLDRHALKAVREWGLFLAGVTPSLQTEELCLAAVRSHPRAILYVRDQTPTIAWATVEGDPMAIQFIRDQTPDLVEMAVRADPGAIQLIRDKAPELEELSYTIRQSRRASSLPL